MTLACSRVTLDRDMLDAISTDIPIWVVCYAPHIIYTNTPMIEKTGATEDSRIHGLGRFPRWQIKWLVYRD